jgi:hypothetical protein
MMEGGGVRGGEDLQMVRYFGLACRSMQPASTSPDLRQAGTTTVTNFPTHWSTSGCAASRHRSRLDAHNLSLHRCARRPPWMADLFADRCAARPAHHTPNWSSPLPPWVTFARTRSPNRTSTLLTHTRHELAGLAPAAQQKGREQP